MNNSLTNELKIILDDIKENIIKEYPSNKIGIEHFLISVLEHEESVAYKIISRNMLDDNIMRIKEYFYTLLTRSNTYNDVVKTTISPELDKCITNALNELEINDVGINVNSGHVLCAILKRHNSVSECFRQVGVSYKHMIENVINESVFNEEKKNDGNTPMKHHKKNKVATLPINNKNTPIGEVERNLINLNKIAAEGKIDEVIGNDDIINDIFTILSKKNKNNVIVVGESGVGKTATVKHIANLLCRNDVPKPFINKKLMQFDFISLVSGTLFKGAFESKFNPIIEDAKNKGCYILFVDDIQNILNDKSKLSETDINSLLDMMLNEKNIQFICTISNKGYSNFVETNPSLARKFQKVTINEMTYDDCINVVNKRKEKYEIFHNVKFDEKCITTCTKLAKRYITTQKLPDSVFDIIDEVGATISLKEKENDELINLSEKLNNILFEKEEYKKKSLNKDYSVIDELTKREIEIKTRIKLVEKKVLLDSKPIDVTCDDIKKLISKKTNIPLQDLDNDERKRLRNLNTEIKQYVIGQEEAVDEVCKVVKRQRIGLANPNKPSVLFFGGSTGTGKTYLAKKLAEKVFGDEKYLVRIDMSEYSDKTSVNKLIGSSHGYVGYEEGGILTEAIKRNKYCVLLLDEIEKANEQVHNIFLQLFDDGKLTDNKGTIVDFKNVIVIMTSNIGASEVSARGNGIGFNKNVSEKKKEIIEKEMKKKFKPEFINRINKVVFFNRLNEENLKEIIKLEIKKINEKLKNIDYSLDNTIMGNKMVDRIYENIKDKIEYGARPILREVETEIEDKITDLIIDGDVEEKHMFSFDEIV